MYHPGGFAAASPLGICCKPIEKLHRRHCTSSTPSVMYWGTLQIGHLTIVAASCFGGKKKTTTIPIIPRIPRRSTSPLLKFFRRPRKAAIPPHRAEPRANEVQPIVVTPSLDFQTDFGPFKKLYILPGAKIRIRTAAIADSYVLPPPDSHTTQSADCSIAIRPICYPYAKVMLRV